MPQHTKAERRAKRIAARTKAQGTVSSAKAKKILRDGTVRGKPLTKAQRGFFGARAGGK